jgi:quercetin dioxygenase-like cupin family protein
MRTGWTFAALTMGVLATGFATVAWGQQAPPVKRTPVEKHDLRGPGMEGIMAVVEIPAGGREGRHIHPGADVFAYIMEGTVTLDLEGQPSATLKAGDHFFIPAGKVHEGINKSSAPVKIIGVFVNEKGKPLTTQVQ